MARILVVDDSALVARFVRQALVPIGHIVETLDSFVRLVTVVRERPPDLILLDLNMPVMSGTSMGRIVQDHQASHIPIVIYSSEAEDKLRDAANKLGAHDWVPKSDDPTELRSVVARVLGERRVVAR